MSITTVYPNTSHGSGACGRPVGWGPALAHEDTAGYRPDPDEPGDSRDRDVGSGDERADEAPTDEHRDTGPGDEGFEEGSSLRAAVRQARDGLQRALALATDPGEPAGGELGGLLELLAALDTGHATAVELTATVQREQLAQRATALPLEGLLAFRSRATYGDRATLCHAAGQLSGMPQLRAAFHAGAVGWAEIRAVLARARELNAAQRARLDAGFADHGRLARLEPDRVVDAADDAVAALRPELERDRQRRAIEHRYLALQPALDGGGRGMFELDAEAYGTVTAALEAAMPPPSAGPADITRHATSQAPDDTPDDTAGEAAADEPGDTGDTDSQPAFCDPVARRSRARQRAEGLLRLAEAFLGGQTGPGPGAGADETNLSRPTPGRPAPQLQAVCDISTLTGHDHRAHTARALIASHGGPQRLTPQTVRRLACDTRLQLIFTDTGEILGTTRPTDTIPAPVRQAVRARDQGCRFPGCTAPIHWTDCHHIRFRQHGGPTTVDNLVVLCRRHHTAVHEGGWKLDMTPDGTITIRRGRQHHTSDPPLRRSLLPP